MTTGRINQVTVVKGADWLLTLERQSKGSEWVSVGKFDRQSTPSSPTWFPSFIVLISNTTLLESKEIYKWIDWNWVFIWWSKEVPPPPLTNPISLVLSLILFWWKWVERFFGIHWLPPHSPIFPSFSATLCGNNYLQNKWVDRLRATHSNQLNPPVFNIICPQISLHTVIKLTSSNQRLDKESRKRDSRDTVKSRLLLPSSKPFANLSLFGCDDYGRPEQLSIHETKNAPLFIQFHVPNNKGTLHRNPIKTPPPNKINTHSNLTSFHQPLESIEIPVFFPERASEREHQYASNLSKGASISPESILHTISPLSLSLSLLPITPSSQSLSRFSCRE